MKLATVLAFVVAVAALPAAKNGVATRASYPKVDGLKFNIDGTTKCELILRIPRIFTDFL